MSRKITHKPGGVGAKSITIALLVLPLTAGFRSDSLLIHVAMIFVLSIP